MAFEGFLKLSTAVNKTVLIVSSTDHISGKTGLAAGLTIYAGKAAGVPAAITPVVTELDATNAPGKYKLAFTTAHTNTLGELALTITGAGADPADYKWEVATNLPGETQDANLVSILGTALTETAGQLAAGFKKLFDVAAPVFTLLSTVQTGDSFARLGAPAGASIAADIAEIEGETDGIAAIPTGDTSGVTTLLTRIPGVVQPQTGDSYARLGAPAGASIAADLVEIEAETDGIATLNNLSQADIRTAVGLASANLDTQLAEIEGETDGIASIPTGDTSGVTTLLSRIPGTVQPQTGDAFARLGAPAGASIAVDLAEIEAETDGIAALPTGDTSGVTTLLTRLPGVVQPQTGDTYARLGAAGAGLTALGDARLAHLDADVSTRLPTSSYVAPDNADIVTILAAVDTEIAAIKSKTDQLTFTLANLLDVNVLDIEGADPANQIRDSVLSDATRFAGADIALIKGYVDTEVAAILAAVDTEVAAIKLVTDHLATALELDGAVYRYTINALEQAPSGGGGGGSDPLLNPVPGTYPSGSAGAALGRIGSGQITVVSPVQVDGSFEIIQGDDYLAANARALDWINAAGTWPDLTGATINLLARRGQYQLRGTGSVVVPTGTNQKVRVEISRIQSNVPTGVYEFTIQAILSGGAVVTLVENVGTVLDNND